MAKRALDEIELIKKRSMRKDDSASILTSRSKGEKVLYSIVFVLFALYAFSILYPLFYAFFRALQHKDDYLYVIKEIQGKGLSLNTIFYVSRGLQPNNFLLALTELYDETATGNVYLPGLIWNSIWYTFVGLIVAIFTSTCTAYILSKYKFPGSEFIYAVGITSMIIPVVGTMGSSFKLVSALGLYDTFWFVPITSITAFGMAFLVMYGYFTNISWSYAEAVFIDGGGHLTVFTKIMMPQASAAMVTMGILNFIGRWNDYNTMLIFLPSYPTLASGLYRMGETKIGQYNRPVYFAGLIIGTIPVIAMFVGFSDLIMGNFSIGGLKG